MGILKNIFSKKNDKISSNEDFWNWFIQHEKEFFNVIKDRTTIEKNFFDKISPKLNELKEGFFYLTGMQDDHTVELILTADGVIKNFIFVEQLVALAPQLQGWKFTALKPALDMEQFSIKMYDYTFDTENIHFYANELPGEPDEIDITVVYDHLNEENKKEITNGVFIFLDNYLGELNFATLIDNIEIIGKQAAEKELVPISKLKSFLNWREKEFIEKYEGTRHNTEQDNCSTLEGTLENGNPIFAIINTELLTWDKKASHPWLLTIEIKYQSFNAGLPDEQTYNLLDEIETELIAEMKDEDGYLNVGRETADGIREIYFACKDFRKPALVAYELEQRHAGKLDISYDIYKDKYWRSYNRYLPH